MRIQYASDLHLEHRGVGSRYAGSMTKLIAPTDAEVIVLAGDIGNGTDGIVFANKIALQHNKPVLYVAGNHEYYAHDYQDNLDAMRSAASSNVHFLERNVVELNGVRFLGATLWTDFAVFGDPPFHMYRAASNLMDYRCIRVQERPLTPVQTLSWHQETRAWLAEQLRIIYAGPTVIITHHAPSAKSLAQQYTHDALSAAFVSNCEDLMSANVELWLHGHTHNKFDYQCNNTRVVCNPAGYPDESFGEPTLTSYAADATVLLNYHRNKK